MNITEYFMKHSRIVLAIIAGIILAGIFTYIKMPKAEDPGFTVRTAVVVAAFPGASPDRVENLVTDKLEKVIQEMPEIKNIKSQSKEGFALLYVDIKPEYNNMRAIWDTLRRKVEKVKQELPKEIIGPFVEDEFYEVYGTVLAIKANGFDYKQMKHFADEAKREFQLIPNVAKVDLIGTQEERIYIEYNNAKLAAIGVSPYMIKQLLESRNIIIPGGDIPIGNERISFIPTGNFNSVDELKKVVVAVPGREEVLYLGDIVDIKQGYEEPPAPMMKASGEKAICIAISLKNGGNIIELGKDVKEKIRLLKEKLPVGVEFEEIYFQPDLVNEKVNEFISNLAESIIIVLVVMLLALGGRTGLLVSSLIPIVVFMTFIIMNIFKIGIDQVSLAALMIALGILVDNSVVMSEATMVNIEHGMKRYDAAIKAVKELKAPLLIATLVISLAFLPIYLCKSIMREYLGGLFIVIAISLLSSWLMSITFVPFLCSKLLKENHSKDNKNEYDSKFYMAYKGLLMTMLKNRVITIIGVVALFVISIYCFKFIPNIFFPESDKPIISASIRLPVGSDIRTTENVVNKIDEFINKELKVNKNRNTGIKNWGTFIGNGAPVYTLTYNPELNMPEYAYMLINVTNEKEIKNIVRRLENFVNTNYPNVEFSGKKLEMGIPVGKPISIRIMGRENKDVMLLAEKIKQKVISMHGTKNVTNDWEEQAKELKINVDQRRAMKAGMTSLDIAISAYTNTKGLEVSTYREGTKTIPIIMRGREEDRNKIEKIENGNVFSMQNGTSVSLNQIANLVMEWNTATIYRKDRLKVATVSADITGDITANEIMKELGIWLKTEKKSWSKDCFYEIGGEEENSNEHMGAIIEQLPIAFVLIMLLLLIQFNSFRKITIILVTIPLGMIGVIAGLLMTGSYFGFMTLLGIISLVGVVINNAIMLLDRIKYELEVNKLKPQDALVSAAMRRIRPILLTMIATVSGLMVLWVKGGLMWQPLAISIIFGLIFATLLTLGIIPVLYSILYNISYKVVKK